MLRELGQARAGWAAGSQFVFSQHCKSLRALGVPDDKIEAVGYWPAASCFTELERFVLAFTDCLVLDRGRVPDQLFAAIHDQLGDQATLELTYITSLYLQHAVMSRALRTEWDDVDERIVEVAGPDDGRAPSGSTSRRRSDAATRDRGVRGRRCERGGGRRRRRGRSPRDWSRPGRGAGRRPHRIRWRTL